jgi:hypothetical protein
MLDCLSFVLPSRILPIPHPNSFKATGFPGGRLDFEMFFLLVTQHYELFYLLAIN